MLMESEIIENEVPREPLFSALPVHQLFRVVNCCLNVTQVVLLILYSVVEVFDSVGTAFDDELHAHAVRGPTPRNKEIMADQLAESRGRVRASKGTATGEG